MDVNHVIACDLSQKLNIENMHMDLDSEQRAHACKNHLKIFNRVVKFNEV